VSQQGDSFQVFYLPGSEKLLTLSRPAFRQAFYIGNGCNNYIIHRSKLRYHLFYLYQPDFHKMNYRNKDDHIA